MYKNDRTAEDIRREITAVIRELKESNKLDSKVVCLIDDNPAKKVVF